MTRSRRWQLSLFIGTLLVLLVFSACNGDDNGDSSDNNDSTSNEAVDVNPSVSPTEAVTQLPPENPSIIPTITPIPSLTLTPTLPYESWRVAGEWSINFRYTVTNGGPFVDVDEWIYSGSASIFIEESGNVTGSGILYPSPTDEACNVTALDSDGYPFSVTGILNFDGERILMDITMDANDYFAVENYTVLCPDYLEPLEVQNNFIWPMLGQIERLTYTFWLDESSFEINFAEDLGQRTNRVLVGMLNGEILLQR